MDALRKVFPVEFIHLSRSLSLLVGFSLIMSAPNIYRRKRTSGITVLTFPLPRPVVEADWILSLLVSLIIIFFAYLVFGRHVPIALPQDEVVSPGPMARLRSLFRELAVSLREIGRLDTCGAASALPESFCCFRFWPTARDVGLWPAALILAWRCSASSRSSWNRHSERPIEFGNIPVLHGHWPDSIWGR
jgi:hypothetical protein